VSVAENTGALAIRIRGTPEHQVLSIAGQNNRLTVLGDIRVGGTAQDDGHDRVKVHALLDGECERLGGRGHVNTSQELVHRLNLVSASDTSRWLIS
jgi:hypothetical protein